jgi:C1A family cysteine protease
LKNKKTEEKVSYLHKTVRATAVFMYICIFSQNSLLSAQDLSVTFTQKLIPDVPLKKGQVAPIHKNKNSALDNQEVIFNKGLTGICRDDITPSNNKKELIKKETIAKANISSIIKKIPAQQIQKKLKMPVKNTMKRGPVNIPSSLKEEPPKLSGWTNIMSENFEGTFPSGSWQTYGNPTWGKDDYKPYAGSNSVWCARGGGQGQDPDTANYAHNMEAWAVYGPFDLSDALDAELIFQVWNISETNYDYFAWMASTDEESFYGYMISGDSNGWVNINFDLSAVPTLGNLCGTSQVWITLYFESDSDHNNKGSFVDDIVLKKNVSAILPNLIADYTPDGWDYPIVPSSVPETNTVGPDLQADVTTYIDIAFVNRNEDIPAGTNIYLYLNDGATYLAGWYWDGLEADYYAYIEDYMITFTSGDHTLKSIVDPMNSITESNEDDNEYQRIFSWGGISGLPNLIADYKPDGWDYPIVPSSVTETNTIGPDLQGGSTTFIDFAFVNRNADIPASTNIYVYLYDGITYLIGYYWEGLEQDYYGYVEDYEYSFSDGNHTLKTSVDPTSVITESNENDNIYQNTFSWGGVDQPNLIADYTPSGWDYPIVPSSVSGTNTIGPALQPGETTFIDLAFVNRGMDIPSETYIYVYLYDGATFVDGWYWEGIQQDYYGYIEDYEHVFTEGNNTIKTSVDHANDIPESNESDNIYQKTFNWGGSGIEPDIQVSPQDIHISQNGNSSSNSDIINCNDCNQKDSERAKGLIIPEDIKKYWKSRTPLLKYNIPDLKGSIDWSSKDSPVKDQMNCGSCWAFAAIAFIENLGDKTDLSEQVIVSCIASNDCDGGWYGYALEYIHNEGVPPENCYPYSATNGNCSNKCPDPAYLEKVTQFDLYGHWGDPTSSTINDLKALLQTGPVIVAMLVPDEFSYYTGGIFDYNGGPIPEYNGHAVLLVGYNDTQEYFKVKNSWGTNWGESGYFRISYNDVTDDVQFGGYPCVASGIYTEGGDNIFTISNLGTSTLVVDSISTDKSWLNFTPQTIPNIPPSGQQIVSLSVSDWNAVGCPDEQGTLIISSNDPDEPDVNVIVTAAPLCQKVQPVLDIDLLSLTFSVTEGGTNPDNQTFMITNIGNGTMTWTITDTSSWLSESPPNGSTTSETDQITVSVDATGLTASGSPYTDTITITAPGATDSPQTIDVSLNVLPVAYHFNPVEPTGDSRPVVIQNATIDGTPIKTGDEVGIFDGSLCVGAASFNGTFPIPVTVWMEVAIPENPVLPGAKNGHSMLFKIWNGSEYGAKPAYLTGSGVFGEPLTVVSALEATNYTTQTIPILHGSLNIVSFNVLPQNLAANKMVDDLENLVMVQDDEGNFFTPSYSVNTIGDVDLTNGYKLYISGSEDDNIINIGTPLVPQSYSIELDDSRRYMIGYPYQNPNPVLDVFASIASSIVIVQDDLGQFYIPSQSVNTLGNMQPGKGYQIFVDKAVNFTYPSLASSLVQSRLQSNKHIQTKYFQFQQTGAPYAVIITDSETLLTEGDEIGIFSIDLCVGASVFNGDFNFVLSAWEENKEYNLDGFKKGEEIHFKIWKEVENKEIEMTGQFVDPVQSTFGSGPFSIASLYTVAVDEQIPSRFALDQNYPNPFNPETYLRFHVKKGTHVNLAIYNLKGKLIRLLEKGYFESGSYRVKWDGRTETGQNVAGGIYICRFQTDAFKATRKLMYIK